MAYADLILCKGFGNRSGKLGQAKASGQMLDVDEASKAHSALVDQYQANGQTNQEWNVISIGGCNFELNSVNSGLALDVYGESTASGADIDQYTYGGNAWQQWKFTTH